MRPNIVIATIKQWNVANAVKLKTLLEDEFNFYLIQKKEDLKPKLIRQLKPEYIFFPHWSWKVPEEIYTEYECIGFHMTNLPFGRGGSPLQNLIQRKVYNTKITAFKITGDLDAGDVYLKRDLFIGLGNAEEIYMLASEIIFFDMIPYILRNRPQPKRQEGEVVIFKRRTPEQSDLLRSGVSNLQDIYDFIRMLDAEGYPKAFIKIGKLKIEFSEAHKKHNKVVGRFEIVEEA